MPTDSATNMLTITADERFQDWAERHYEDLGYEWNELEETREYDELQEKFVEWTFTDETQDYT